MRVDAITHQVLKNCALSDSRHAGLYSICGLALRLRDLYKWEKGLEPWIEEDPAEISGWIGQKEEEWEQLGEDDFQPITISDRIYDPFDAEGINKVLEPHGLFYGAGYVHSLKPTFFLALIDEKKTINGHTIYILAHELARDLFTTPALHQEGVILVRKEAGKLFLWDQILFLKESGRQAFRFGLEHFGLSDQDLKSLRLNLERIFTGEMERYIYHELGEMEDTVFDREIWQNIIATFPHTPVELFVRTIKDLLADTHGWGALSHITQERKTASLAFYVAFLDGLRKDLFPEMREAFKTFMEIRDWQRIEQAVRSGHLKAKGYAEEVIHIFRSGEEMNDMEWTKCQIERRLLVPLGIVRVHR